MLLLGVGLSMLYWRFRPHQPGLRTYAVVAAVVLASGPFIFQCLTLAGFDPLWSFTLARRWCARTQWVHMDTTLFYALTRDGSALLGNHDWWCVVLLGMFLPFITTDKIRTISTNKVLSSDNR